MAYIFLILSLLACFHAYTFARWLRKNGNAKGAAMISLLIAIGVILPLYRIFTAP